MKKHQRQACSLVSQIHSLRKRAVIGRMFSPLVESLGKWWLGISLPLFLIQSLAVQTYQRVSLVCPQDGKQKPTNGIRLRTTSSSRCWKPRREMEIRKRVSQTPCALCDSCLTLFVSVAEASSDLRRHFYSRSAALLVPLNRYLNTLIPRPSETSTGVRLKSFNNANFFASLKAHGAVLPFRSSTKQREFYERWLRTPAFGLWLARQEDLVARTLENARNEKGRQGTL